MRRVFVPADSRTQASRITAANRNSKTSLGIPSDTMPAVIRAVALTCLLSTVCLAKPTGSIAGSPAQEGKLPSYPYDVARAHEISPHRRTIPLEGVRPVFGQLHLALTVSPTGDVIDVKASGDPEALKFWPQLQTEVRGWKFTPFEENGKAVTAEVEEYIDLVPPERLPRHHVAAPVLRPDSKAAITLERTGCFGSCPSYVVTVSTDGLVFNGRSFVVAPGSHTAAVDANEVRALAARFVAADFYSMDPRYAALVTDNPTYVLSVTIDGHTKQVVDYVGSWVGMPSVITELEHDVDSLARTQRWIEGSDGLVEALGAEKFNFRTFEAQAMLREAAARGSTVTVTELLDAGVPLERLAAPKLNKADQSANSEPVGWLTAASGHLETLEALIDAGASEDDQKDKDLALAGAAGSGNVAAARALLADGADPNGDLSQLTVTENSPGMTIQGKAAGSVLIYAAESGNPDMVREILRYQPELETRDQQGRTALFAAGDYRYGDKDGARVECVRLLVQAGADVNARDNEGDTPLHETFLTDVEEELLKLGADVNARNKDGETPIFTTVDNDAIPLFLKYGADLSIRNNKGQTVMEAAKEKGPLRQKALRKAIQKLNQP